MRFFRASLIAISLCLCGTLGQSNSHRRFHYGQDAASADEFFAPLLRKSFWPWYDMEYVCAGTWIHAIYVLTTAYCLKEQKPGLEVNRVGDLRGKVTSWTNDLDCFELDGQFFMSNYSEKGVNRFENDVALVRVKKAVTTYPIGPFPTIFDGWGNPSAIERDQVVLYGFGWTENHEYAPKLKYMKGSLHFSDDFFQYKCSVPSCKMGLSFCFEPQAARDISDGDTGSPVYYRIKNPANPERENRILIGIVSNRMSESDPRNIILTNLTRYYHWIHSITSL